MVTLYSFEEITRMEDIIMFCKQCGQSMPDGTQFCPSCGCKAEDAQAPQQQPQAQPYQAQPTPTAIPAGLARKDYLKKFASKSIRSQITVCAIIAYVCAGLTLFLNVIASGNAYGMIDVLLVLGLGLAIHLTASRACAIALLVYSVINIIITIVLTGAFGGWLVLLVGIYAVIATFAFQKEWNTYQQQFAQPMQQ